MSHLSPEPEQPDLCRVALARAPERDDMSATIARALHWKPSTFGEVVGVERPDCIEDLSVVALAGYRERKVM